MDIVHEIYAVRAKVAEARAEGKKIGFMMTTGGLHTAHVSLIESLAKKCDYIVVSNTATAGDGTLPTHINPSTPEDATTLADSKADLLFAPTLLHLYGVTPPMDLFNVTARGLVNTVLCAATRPGLYSMTVTLALKLFNIVKPDYSIFGEKDFQQYIAVRRMVADLNLDVKIVTAPVQRHGDGLAMASRNARLDAYERECAPAMYHALCHVRDGVLAGRDDFDELEAEGKAVMQAGGLTPDYLEVRCDFYLRRPTKGGRFLRVYGSALLGPVRLVDTLPIQP